MDLAMIGYIQWKIPFGQEIVSTIRWAL